MTADVHHGAGLTDLEIAAGYVTGGRTVALPETGLSGRQALEAVVLEAMSQRRAVVSFSGGRDSSAVLALATAVARREGLPDPVPVTKRYPGVPDADESDWQELVVRHLGLRDWEILEIRDELDLVGDVAAGVLRRHGLLWPPNLYLHEPLFARFPGTVLMTGFDGDRLFDGWRYRTVVPALGRRRPRPNDLRRLASRYAPAGLVVRAGAPAPTDHWLEPSARREMDRATVSDRREPQRWDRRLAWLAGRRIVDLVTSGMRSIADAHDVQVLHPLVEPLALAGLANSGGWRGWPDRTSALRALLPDLLPDAVLARTSKAVFGGAIVGEATRQQARVWSERGVRHVDADALRAEWLSPRPVFSSMTALQAGWLADRAG